MIIRDETGSYVGMKCDLCGVMTPPAADILAGHGLNNMGWQCSGGSHLCPAHVHPDVIARTPAPAPSRDTSATL